ncbi:rhomboid family intramembrane serine protease [Cesiribacter andamanensis]|uniref:Rhombosortase n=1 Tax=Cesiribacter andamanensis AMV16 TaxID=1279009 RepID=M7N1X1_9BACT|nr:rhomboid family intramembrane serine protease [Cesiribacter andamanensis]EMR01272.1 rhombosortase [Cesiribacter andamanensis AMV16]
MFRLTPVVKNLLIINVAVFLGALLLDVYQETVHFFALYYMGSDNFRAWQFVTYMFLHGDHMHLLGNMIGLAVFGPWLEELWGSKRFLQYYLITGLGAAVLFMGVDFFEHRQMQQDVDAYLSNPSPELYVEVVQEHFARFYPNVRGLADQYYQQPENEALAGQAEQTIRQLYELVLDTPMLGASGAIFGLLMAVGLLFPHRRIMLLIPPIPMRVRIFVLLYGALEVYLLLKRVPTDNVAHMAHLGGMFVGYLLLVVWGEARNRYQ